MSQARQEIERKVIRRLIREMKKAGWSIAKINDGGEPDEDILHPNETVAMETVFSVDESTIYFSKGELIRTAIIILGNDGYDCIADHSCSNHALVYDNFEEVMNEVQEYADKFDDGAMGES